MKKRFTIIDVALWLIPIIAIAFTALSCTPPADKPNCIEQEYDVLSLRVDDDAQYHLTVRIKSSGRVKSFSDLSQYGIDPITIVTVSHITNPIMFHAEWASGCKSTGYRIWLPSNYQITYFED